VRDLFNRKDGMNAKISTTGRVKALSQLPLLEEDSVTDDIACVWLYLSWV
jgi:hypothetical protein